ncbi:MAG: nucleotidyltransferase family protein [Ornithinimicrobium sp.]|jgi:predicted nucleotidyltransferase|uniref:nucleotidyltransferase family protein n=1 Tax=Ornithinimicrobium sp. TaxID=1977084 RepID=UPI003D9B1074
MVVMDRETLADLCRHFDVRRLSVFGSAMTDRFDECRSDVDFLVEFTDSSAAGFDARFGLKEALEALVGRRVDLVMPSAMENPYIAASVEATAEQLYAA